ncbi:DUF6151 family protein [Pseudoalteromonas sp. MTN2-4]|uniref:DUF6151 family protein n=1 Tax=Pseudoalteromonas sp. MTN2-4 TaxID=3056555 RepID=UPI0036F2ECDE
MENLKLKCKCGEVTGVVSNVKPGCGNRLVCYCEDCRNFAKQFNKTDDILNEFGGTEIFQIDPSRITINHGLENISCLKLSNKGLYRWYASCCQTPIGNTVGLNLPFVGLIHSFIASDQNIDFKIGPIIGSVYTEHATGNPSDELKAGKSKVSLLFTILRKLLIWKILGKGSPNPFFHKDGKPIVEPTLVSRNKI